MVSLHSHASGTATCCRHVIFPIVALGAKAYNMHVLAGLIDAVVSKPLSVLQ